MNAIRRERLSRTYWLKYCIVLVVDDESQATVEEISGHPCGARVPAMMSSCPHIHNEPRVFHENSSDGVG